jgi:hypothetical protein
MDELKKKLFEETLYCKERYLELRKEYGDFDILVAVAHGKFVVLYGIVEEMGLDAEFQEWKKGDMPMKWKDKIRSMSDDELAEFILDSADINGFVDKACIQCPYHQSDGVCSANARDRECTAAVKKLLESEVEE